MSLQLVQSEPDLGDELLDFIRDIDRLETPHAVLDALHDITWRHCKLKMMGALRFPKRAGDIESLVQGETVFLHDSMPRGFWEEWLELSHRQPGLGYLLAQQSLAPFTMTDLQRMVEPLAAEQWSFDLAHKYGILDGLTCPVGGRWLVAYWSKKVLADDFTPELRAMLYTGASFAAPASQ